MFFFRTLTNVVCVDFVVGRDVEYRKIRTIWRQAATFVKVGTFNHLEHRKIILLTVNQMGIVMVTMQHNLIVSVCFM